MILDYIFYHIISYYIILYHIISYYIICIHDTVPLPRIRKFASAGLRVLGRRLLSRANPALNAAGITIEMAMNIGKIWGK